MRGFIPDLRRLPERSAAAMLSHTAAGVSCKTAIAIGGSTVTKTRVWLPSIKRLIYNGKKRQGRGRKDMHCNASSFSAGRKDMHCKASSFSASRCRTQS